jgi:hypothetical protein
VKTVRTGKAALGYSIEAEGRIAGNPVGGVCTEATDLQVLGVGGGNGLGRMVVHDRFPPHRPEAVHSKDFFGGRSSRIIVPSLFLYANTPTFVTIALPVRKPSGVFVNGLVIQRPASRESYLLFLALSAIMFLGNKKAA